jgi:hypothetical protein
LPVGGFHNFLQLICAGLLGQPQDVIQAIAKAESLGIAWAQCFCHGHFGQLGLTKTTAVAAVD